MGLELFKTTGIIKMSEDEQRAWQEDNHYFMDENQRQYVKDAVIVAIIFGVCAGIVIGVAIWQAMAM